jgi:putative phosphoribosyl transferase
MKRLFYDRTNAGQKLAQELKHRTLVEPLLLAISIGGVPVATQVSVATGIPWEFLVTQKIIPSGARFSVGAMTEDGYPLLTEAAYLREGVVEDSVISEIEQVKERIKNKIKIHRNGRSLPELHEKEVILIDDGLTTGISAAASARFIKSQGARRIILAVPVGPDIENPLLMEYVDEVICLHRPVDFQEVSVWYENFRKLDDPEVVKQLRSES